MINCCSNYFNVLKLNSLFLIFSFFLLSCNGGDKQSQSVHETGDKKDTVTENKKEDDTKAQEPHRRSPKKVEEFSSEQHEVIIKYGAPSIRGRKIWGNLVPYGRIWRAGANETTSINFSKAVTIQDQLIEPGIYAFFIFPKKDKKWSVILNEEWSKEKHDAWGAYGYDAKKNVATFKIQPKWVDKNQEKLAYSIDKVSINMRWGRLKIEIPYQVTD